MYGYFMLGTKMLFGLFLSKKKKKKRDESHPICFFFFSTQ